MSPQNLISAELFAGLPIRALEAAAAAGDRQRVRRGTRIFSQGDDRSRAHAVIEGGVRISRAGRDGAQVVVRFIRPGEMFGAAVLFADRRYAADAVAVTETVEASWSEQELLKLMMRYPQIAINTIRVLGRRLQDMQDRARELATRRVDQRIARALLRLAHPSERGRAAATAIPFPLRRKDVADIAGTTLYTASRILTGWEKMQWLAREGHQLTIRNPSELFRIAEGASEIHRGDSRSRERVAAGE